VTNRSLVSWTLGSTNQKQSPRSDINLHHFCPIIRWWRLITLTCRNEVAERTYVCDLFILGKANTLFVLTYPQFTLNPWWDCEWLILSMNPCTCDPARTIFKKIWEYAVLPYAFSPYADSPHSIRHSQFAICADSPYDERAVRSC